MAVEGEQEHVSELHSRIESFSLIEVNQPVNLHANNLSARLI